MNELELWREKLAQILHDPFLKAWCQGGTAKTIAMWLGEQLVGEGEAVPEVLWESFAQEKVAALLSNRLLGEEFVFSAKLWKQAKALAEELDAGGLPAALQPDWAATGADRPNLGTARQTHVRLWDRSEQNGPTITITHPLDRAPLRVPAPATEEALLERLRPAVERLDAYRSLLPSSGAERFRKAWYLLWRRLPEELAEQDGVFWPLQPADTRCPDHSIWDHLRVASALVFVPRTKTADERVRGNNSEKRPWLLSLWVGPVRDFVGQARTSRDLWTGSMLLSELAWSLIEPLVEALGPDAVLYPDLRANPRADRWIDEWLDGESGTKVFGEKALGRKPAGSRASSIPNRLIAVVPEERLDELTERCVRSARERWRTMARYVRTWLHEKLPDGPWHQVFDRQAQAGPAVRWSAVHWDWDGVESKPRRQDIRLNPAVPFQSVPDALPEEIGTIEQKRENRFRDWVDREPWDHYQAARQTALMTHPGYLLNQRGFDYPLFHHQLLGLDAARSRMGLSRGDAAVAEEPGEKCTLCGSRQALSNAAEGDVTEQRAAARKFWRELEQARRSSSRAKGERGTAVDGEPSVGDESGAERLCGVCAIRRFLSDTADPIQRNWASTVHSESRSSHDVPFPSTGLVAGQSWLVAVCDSYLGADRDVRSGVEALVEVCFNANIERTQFADTLARLRRVVQHRADDTLKKFLQIDIQYLAPERWDALERQSVVTRDLSHRAREACRRLRRRLGSPSTHLAVIALDGDQMGRLLLGDPERVQACWRDVIHPEAVRQIREDTDSAADTRWKVFWRATLERPRLLGPSTHAFITRALRYFASRLLPWVVEREHGGRLIYAGGDDALVLCPAIDALPLVQRLDEVFTAPWVLDREPATEPWPQHEPSESLYDVGSSEARQRFVLVKGDGDLVEQPGQIVPMLGQHQSFSAGIAFGHFKTSLRVLRARSRVGLEQAKDAGGRRAGLSWLTRSGLKLQWIAPLSAKQAGNVQAIQTLAKSFRRSSLAQQMDTASEEGQPSMGPLPSRLPYKLRELLPLARAIMRAPESDSQRIDLLQGLIARELDGLDPDAPEVKEVAVLWQAGLMACDGDLDRSEAALEGSLGGLLLARALAGLEEES